jgi:hypothetical protein
MKIKVNPDCGNSPKKNLIKELTILFATYEINEVKQYFAEDIKWTLVGDRPIKGRQELASALMEMSGNKASELTLHSIITHGREASVHGEMSMENGHHYGFSDFYVFTSPKASKVKSITSFVIQIKE